MFWFNVALTLITLSAMLLTVSLMIIFVHVKGDYRDDG